MMAGKVPTTAETTAEAATAAISVLDKATINFKKHHATSDVLKVHFAKLTNTRKLLVKIEYQKQLHLSGVATALDQVWGVLKRLHKTLATEPFPIDQFTNVLGELEQATINLRAQIPGDVLESSNNNVKDGFQNNSLLGAEASADRQISSTASGNKAEKGFQSNAPIYGKISDIKELAGMWK